MDSINFIGSVRIEGKKPSKLLRYRKLYFNYSYNEVNHRDFEIDEIKRSKMW